MSHVLIVDDSISVRKALEMTLNHSSIPSTSTVSAEEAIKLLEAGNKYDLLIVDVIMDGMSGIELCQKVKTDSRFSHLPVILMSGNVDDIMKAQAKQVNADSVLRKPFKREELIPMIEGFLSKKQAAPAEAKQAEQEILPQSQLDDLNYLLQTYEDNNAVRDVVILDRAANPIKQTGNVLPDNIKMFVKFFTNTAGVLGKQMIGKDISQISIAYGDHEMIIHNLTDHFLIVLMNKDQKKDAIKA